LIAEDDNINYLLIKKLIHTLDCDIVRAENGQVAVTICEQNPNINLLLLDIKMPVMNGYEAFEIISKMRPKLPIIAQTAYSSVEDREKIEKMGFTDYITKPLDKAQLLEKISLNL
jgi:CheY-like chemotaxis protein